MKKIVVLLALLLASCGSPEATLKKGYQTSSSVVKTTTILVNRDQMSVPAAQRVHTLGTTAKESLDAGADALEKCRAKTPTAKCTAAVADIDMGAGVLQQLEDYLKSKEAK